MKQVTHVALGLLSVALPAATAPAQKKGNPDKPARTPSCTSSGCHTRIRQFQRLHEPVATGRCDACHKPKPNAAFFQAGPRHEFEVAGGSAELCFTCHERAPYTATATGGNLKFVHKPTETGVCTLCHDPHGADGANLLRIDVDRQLCVRCHRITFDRGEHVHPPVSDGACLVCHNPHGSDHEKFLRAAPPELCLDCHDTIEDLLDEATGVHGAITSGQSCISCHNPHAGTFSGLLTKANPSGSYFPFEEEGYALCFDCHEVELVEEDRDPEVTEFRNGDLNLHYLHVNRQEKGCTCSVCHNPHAGTGVPHMADSTVLGEQAILGKYNPTESGGACLTKCHATWGYDREEPIQNKGR